MKKILAISVTTLLFLCSCGDLFNPLTVSPEQIVLYSEGTSQITTNKPEVSYVSLDDFYASVDQTGLVTAHKVGDTSITVLGDGESKKIPVTVNPLYTLYPDLDKLIGKSESDVMATLGSPYNVEGNIWVYVEYNSYADGIGIGFENGRVSNAITLISIAYSSMIIEALFERYNYIGTEDDYYFFMNHNEEVVISLTVYNLNYLEVIYIPNTFTKAIDELPEIIQEVTERYHF